MANNTSTAYCCPLKACGGIDPANVLPVLLDVGTNNKELLNDPYYLGLKQRRERGPAYDALVEEFILAAQDRFGPDVLIQFEDFGNLNAFRLLEKWQDKACTFNDDIQGTASVALAGLITSNKLTGKKISDHVFLFNGAGEAGTGIADLIAYAITIEINVTMEEARSRIWLVDSKGLVTLARKEELQHHKLLYAHASTQECKSLFEAVQLLRPSCLIGVSAVPSSFDERICKAMASWNERPIICALSNPTSKAECTAKQAYEWTDGRAIFSSGSPFDPVTLSDGRRFAPGQGELVRQTRCVQHASNCTAMSYFCLSYSLEQETMPTFSQDSVWVAWQPLPRGLLNTTCILRPLPCRNK